MNEPIPIRSELLDERTWKRLLAASSPLVDCIAGKDKFIAGQLDSSSCIARFDGIAFVAA